MVWPYGGYTKWAVDIGREAGFEAFFGLNGGFNLPSETSLSDARRGIIENTLVGDKFAAFLKTAGYTGQNVNAAQLDIDLIYDQADANETEHNLSLAIERFNNAGINTVFLQAFSDSEGTGNIESVYFYTKEAPVKADIFSHIAARLRSEGFKVYAWMPALACQWLVKDQPENAVLAYADKGKGWYKRATPFSPAVQSRLERLFSDLAAYSYIDGVLFQDDLYLNDYEDFSPAAKKAFHDATGYDLTPDILKDAVIRDKWTKLKTDTLTNLTLKLSKAMQQYRPYLMTARNLYPSLIIEQGSEEWFAQNYNQYLANYNYTVVMAYPYMEKEYQEPLVWLDKLAGAALQNKDNAQKVIFKLQTYDWNKKRWLSTKELNQQLNTLKNKKAVNFAFYPENVFSQ
jgi:biofilm PGA synthesis lipoprotein PgaB